MYLICIMQIRVLNPAILDEIFWIFELDIVLLLETSSLKESE